MEGVDCKEYQWDPNIRNLILVFKMASVSRSKCWIIVIFYVKATLDTTDFDKWNSFVIDKRLTADKCARKHICGHYCGMEGNNA